MSFPADIWSMVSLLFAWAGFLILAWRLFPRKESPEPISDKENFEWPRVSIVIPSRNEEANLARLLPSLKDLDYPSFHIVVVNDNSSDNTRQTAQNHGVMLVDAPERPEGWVGKNWAAQQAEPYCDGDILLFTDADTVHEKDSLKRAVSFFLSSQADMMSALPYHRVNLWWEKLLGPFHTVLLAATAPYSPKPKRLFAIGQYLMFSRSSYKMQGGHEAVKSEYPDDLALANACLRGGGSFRIFMGNPLFSVRMYQDFADFVSGWRRNFLAGIQQSSAMATMEVTLIFFALFGAGKIFSGPLFYIPSILSLLFITLRQKRWGDFSFLGVLLAPLSLFLFCLITLLALFDYATGNVLKWKGREYTGWVNRE